MEWSVWQTCDSDGVAKAPDEPGVYEVRITPDSWVYEEGQDPVVYIGAGSTSVYTVRRMLADHIEGRGNQLLKSLMKTHAMVYRHAFVSNPSQVLFDLLMEFKKAHGGMPVCNRTR
jgi:hypothetical protein